MHTRGKSDRQRNKRPFEIVEHLGRDRQPDHSRINLSLGVALAGMTSNYRVDIVIDPWATRPYSAIQHPVTVSSRTSKQKTAQLAIRSSTARYRKAFLLESIQLALIEPWSLKYGVPYLHLQRVYGVEYHNTSTSDHTSQAAASCKVSAPGFLASWLPPAQPLFLSNLIQSWHGWYRQFD